MNRLTSLPARPTLIITAGFTLITVPLGRCEMSLIQSGLERLLVK